MFKAGFGYTLTLSFDSSTTRAGRTIGCITDSSVARLRTIAESYRVLCGRPNQNSSLTQILYQKLVYWSML